MIGWCQEQRHDASCRSAGWQGVMTLPRIVALDDAGALTFQVAPEVQRLEGRTMVHLHECAGDAAQHALRHVAGDTFVIKATLLAHGDAEICISVRHDPTTGEETRIVWNRQRNELRCDMSACSRNQNTSHDCYVAPLHVHTGDELQLDIYVDRSIVEIYAGAYTVCSLRVYPLGSAQHTTFTARGEVVVRELVVRAMQGNNQ